MLSYEAIVLDLEPFSPVQETRKVCQVVVVILDHTKDEGR